MAREKFKFWLDLDKDGELLVAEQIDELKRSRQFTATIRNGIRLICDLKAGRLDILFELFPWVRADFLEYMASIQPQKSEADRAIAEQLARIETLLASDKSVSSVIAQESRGGPKKMAVPQFAAPVFDDDVELVAVSRVNGSANAAQNFLNSALNLVVTVR